MPTAASKPVSTANSKTPRTPPVVSPAEAIKPPAASTMVAGLPAQGEPNA
ncbi:hypothetical protein PQR15_37055 [Streptomyces lydicus]|nr:hypothetical protein [Streptomyces lydicus]